MGRSAVLSGLVLGWLLAWVRACPLRSQQPSSHAAADGRESRGWCGPAAALGRAGDRREPGAGPGPAGPATPATQPLPPAPPGQPPLVRSLEPAKPFQPPEPLFQPVNRPSPPLEPTDVRFPINLATALRLSDARPLIVAAAQASVWVAEAELTRAKVLWVPTLNIGFDYIRHDGGGPDFNKGIMTAPERQLLLRRRRPVRERRPDRRHLPAPGRAAGPERPRTGTSRPPRTTPCCRPPTPTSSVHQYRGMYAGALYSRRAGPRPGRADRRS